MGRWEPDARERLRDAALDLFLEQGFEATSVAGIAERAGLTERTFFRHFADKREVLFQGQDALAVTLRERITGMPPGAGWLEVGEHAVAGLEEFFSAERRPFSRRRQRVIDADPALREREQLKMAILADTAAAAFGERGLDASGARLAAEVLIAVFKVAFGAWVAPDETRTFADLVRAAATEVRAA